MLNRIAASLTASAIWLGASLCAQYTAKPESVRQKGSAAESYQRGVRFFMEQQPEKAAAEFLHSLALNPQQPRVVKLLGLCYHLTNETDKAEAAFFRARELAPEDVDAWFFLGRLYYRQNFFHKALETLEAAAKLDSRDHRVHHYLGLTLEALGDIENALEEYRNAIRWNGKKQQPDFRPHISYGILLSKLGRLSESEQQLKRAKELDAAVWEIYFELAKVYYRREELDAALRELNAALEAGTPNQEEAARIYHLMARVYFDMGRPEDAQRALDMRKPAP